MYKNYADSLKFLLRSFNTVSTFLSTKTNINWSYGRILLVSTGIGSAGFFIGRRFFPDSKASESLSAIIDLGSTVIEAELDKKYPGIILQLRANKELLPMFLELNYLAKAKVETIFGPPDHELISKMEKAVNSALNKQELWNKKELQGYLISVLAVIEDKLATYYLDSENDLEKSRKELLKIKKLIDNSITAKLDDKKILIFCKQLAELDKNLPAIYAKLIYSLAITYIYSKKYITDENEYKTALELFNLTYKISEYCFNAQKKKVFTEILSEQNVKGIMLLESNDISKLYEAINLYNALLLKANDNYYDVQKDGWIDLRDNSRFRADCMAKISKCYAKLGSIEKAFQDSHKEKFLLYMLGEEAYRKTERVEGATIIMEHVPWRQRRNFNMFADSLLTYYSDDNFSAEAGYLLANLPADARKELYTDNLDVAESLYQGTISISKSLNDNHRLVTLEAQKCLTKVEKLKKERMDYAKDEKTI